VTVPASGFSSPISVNDEPIDTQARVIYRTGRRAFRVDEISARVIISEQSIMFVEAT